MEREGEGGAHRAPANAVGVFGDALPRAQRYANRLAGPGVARGVIGPGEADRLWERHLLNSAGLAGLVPPRSRLLDVGSGAGLPGIPLALARPDVEVELLEATARRVRWLRETVAELDLPIGIHHVRAEDVSSGAWNVVVARAVAPLARLSQLGLGLVDPGGVLLAMKGRTAWEELARDRAAVEGAGGTEMEVVECGIGVIVPPPIVVRIRRADGGNGRRDRAGGRCQMP